MPSPEGDRRAEWSLIRRSALLGDVVDEDTFAVMCGVSRKQLRNKRTATGAWLGVEIPIPIARPENGKPLFLKSEAEDFVRAFKAARKARQ